MSKINTAKIKHFIRLEEKDILEFLLCECDRLQLTLIGEDGEVTATDCLTYSCLKEKVMAVKMI